MPVIYEYVNELAKEFKVLSLKFGNMRAEFSSVAQSIDGLSNEIHRSYRHAVCAIRKRVRPCIDCTLLGDDSSALI